MRNPQYFNYMQNRQGGGGSLSNQLIVVKLIHLFQTLTIK